MRRNHFSSDSNSTTKVCRFCSFEKRTLEVFDYYLSSIIFGSAQYGTDWVITHILETELRPIDLEEPFKEHIRGYYPETTEVGFMTFDIAHVMEPLDHGATNYWIRDLQELWGNPAPVTIHAFQITGFNLKQFEKQGMFFLTHCKRKGGT